MSPKFVLSFILLVFLAAPNYTQPQSLAQKPRHFETDTLCICPDTTKIVAPPKIKNNGLTRFFNKIGGMIRAETPKQQISINAENIDN